MHASPSFRIRAPYATDAQRSRGRLVAEPASTSRTEFQRDRDRVIHCSAFRRLAHKTQVFIPLDGDHFRTRLTHSLEVGQIARALARALALDDDLTEAIALAHDLGHTPFGHGGEDALDDLMQPYGGFDHNAQTLRIVTKLERRYAAFNGLNLTFEALEGLVKHNGPLLRGDGSLVARYAARGLPAALLDYNTIFDLELARFPSAEAQAAALADDIAYNAHDIDDGLRAGLISVGDIAFVGFLRGLGGEVEALYPGLESSRFIHEVVRRLITHFIEDAIAESRRRIAESRVASVEEVRALTSPVIAFSPPTATIQAEIGDFLFENLYRHPELLRKRDQAALIIRNLFPHFIRAPQSMPAEWAQAAVRLGPDEERLARLVCDYIAGMTDRYAVSDHVRIFGDAPDLRWPLDGASRGPAVLRKHFQP
jgi:dGTPase